MAFASGRIPNKNVIAIKEPITYDFFYSFDSFAIDYSSQFIGVIQTHILIFLSPCPLRDAHPLSYGYIHSFNARDTVEDADRLSSTGNFAS
jgi:hypothetical protein